jgi:hypothetical protein
MVSLCVVILMLTARRFLGLQGMESEEKRKAKEIRKKNKKETCRKEMNREGKTEIQ